VVPRKRSLADYVLAAENGIYDNLNTVNAIGLFKAGFNVDNIQNPKGDFKKLMKDYNIEYENIWRNLIVDKYILVGNNQNTAHNLINPSTTEGDTGLYELYKNVVVKIVDTMITEEETYRDYQGRNWISRNNIQQGPGVANGNGVSYCYGCKDDIPMFESFVSGCTAPQLGMVPNNYRGKLNRETCVNQAGQVYQYSGLWKDELDVSGTTNQYWPTYWSGIDCSGIVQRAMMKAKQKYQIENNYGIRINVLVLEVDHEKEFQRNEIGSDGFIFPDRSFEFTTIKPELLKKGDIIQYDGHVAIVHSERWGESSFDQLQYPDIRYDIIHAYGSNNYHTQFSRKVRITGNDIRDKNGNIIIPNEFGRIKLW